MAKHSRIAPSRTRGKQELRSGEQRKLIVFSFAHFDQNQGQSFKEWEEGKILAKMNTRLREISNFSVIEAKTNGILKEYGQFPENTEFNFPRYLHPGVSWASLRIAGKERVAGYLEDNVFYIVFLDKDHRFWISEKKHT